MMLNDQLVIEGMRSFKTTAPTTWGWFITVDCATGNPISISQDFPYFPTPAFTVATFHCRHACAASHHYTRGGNTMALPAVFGVHDTAGSGHCQCGEDADWSLLWRSRWAECVDLELNRSIEPLGCRCHGWTILPCPKHWQVSDYIFRLC